MQITKEQVQKLACSDGFAWFKEKFPQGGDYAEIIQALNADKKYEWARWGVSQAYKTFLQGETKAEFIKAETKATDAMVVELNSMEHPADQVEGENSSGDDARIGSSG
ncbi:hypothetical protein, partial [Serratia sp. H1n]|uniref:hypothetical protein n=2 Tax=unclassified Serratia (in: enterobacteria) TaxID=2647522 RepID=UPI0004694631